MEKFLAVCKSPWCKAHFEYTQNDILIVDENELAPTTCPKCKSFDSELSGGVTWTDKEYEGSRFDGTPHEIKYKVTNFRL
jgi:hypothetical protein